VVPERVRTWVQQHVDREIVAVEALGGGRTDTISAVYLDRGDPLVLRHLPVGRWGEVGWRHVWSEARACQLLADAELPVPRLVASDSDAQQLGAYVNLTSWLPGAVRLEPLGPAAIDELARVAAVIHATGVPLDRRLLPYEFWTPAELDVPTWTQQPDLWCRAIALFEAGPPSTPATLLHRDFHPGNILWQGDRISGVIDWAEASWGPSDLDVAHSSTNFALLHDVRRGAAFRHDYRRHGGRVDTDEHAARFWVVSDLLGFLPDPVPIVAALTWTRRDLTDTLVRQRLEHLLAVTLSPSAP